MAEERASGPRVTADGHKSRVPVPGWGAAGVIL